MLRTNILLVFIHPTGNNINNYNNRKLNCKHLIKYYELLQNLQEIEIYSNIGPKLFLPFLRTQLGRSMNEDEYNISFR